MTEPEPEPEPSGLKSSTTSSTSTSTKTKRLNEDEKKQHHNLSEQKRREQLRASYDHLVDLVPDLTPEENRSELAIMNKSIAYIEKLRSENDELMGRKITE